MNFQLLVITLFVALLFASTPIDGAKNGKSKVVNTTLTTTIATNDESKAVLTDNLSSDSTINNATKINEKASYPKKVHSLKKRPTKTPTSYVTASAMQNSKNKRKKVTDVTAAFKDLPADDLEFIKELDKQFQLHGEKIKIKVEHDNSTESEKQNSKRTIDGELGYGAYPAHNGYQYERPKFMFYPYSQQNIPADAPGYYPPKTDVSIEPSYSYELQPQSYVQEQKHGAQQPTEVLDVPKHGAHGAHGGYEEPVIVLRIPGPTKYASHLQTLLQQYLEIRAAQYLRILEENELHKQQHQHAQQHSAQQQEHLLQQEHILQQQQQQQQHKQQAHFYEQQAQLQHGGAAAQAYAEPTLELQPPAHEQHAAQHAPAVNEEHGYSPEVTYAHQIAPTPQAVAYPEIDEIYQGYKGKLHAPQATLQQQHHHEQQQQQQVEYTPQQHEEAPEPQQQLQHGPQYYVQTAPPSAIQQFYYTPNTQFGAHGSHHYQNVYFMAIAPQSGYATTHAAHAAALQHQPIYVQEEEQEPELQQQHHQHEEAAHELAAAVHVENNPRQTHTKVIYTQNSEKGAADYTGSYALPSLRPYERHAAAYHHQQQLQEKLLHEHQQQQQHEQLEQPQQFDYDATLTHAASEHEHEHEQQRSAAIKPQPFNYHAHGAKALRRVNRKRGAPALKATTAATTDVQDEHLQKIRKYVRENLGAQMSTAVEFKTTALVKS